METEIKDFAGKIPPFTMKKRRFFTTKTKPEGP